MKKCLINLLLFVMLLMPFTVFAAGGFSVSPSSSTLTVGDSKTITITSNNAVGKLNIVSSDSSIVSVSVSSTFIQTPGSSVTFTITALKAGSATISVVGTSDFATMDEEILSGVTKNISVKVNNKSNNNNNNNTNKVVTKSSDATLSSLSVISASINFNKDVYTYDYIVDNSVNDIYFDYVTSDSKAKVEITGNENLVVGTNKVVIKVTAEDGTVKEYLINVVKKEADGCTNQIVNNNCDNNAGKVWMVISLVLGIIAVIEAGFIVYSYIDKNNNKKEIKRLHELIKEKDEDKKEKQSRKKKSKDIEITERKH